MLQHKILKYTKWKKLDTKNYTMINFCMGDTFLWAITQWIPETMQSTKPYMHYTFSVFVDLQVFNKI